MPPGWSTPWESSAARAASRSPWRTSSRDMRASTTPSRSTGRWHSTSCRTTTGAWDLYSAGNEIDVYREWAMAIVHGETGSAPSRRYASGMVALRPDPDGRITGYTEREEVHRRHGER